MVKDDFVTENGDLYYFDATGNQPNFVFVSDKAGHWYYMRYFKATKGFSVPFGFDAEFLDRSQSDYETSVHNLNGQQYYFDPKTGIMVTNRYVSDDQGNWYYFGKDGRALHGFQTVDGNLHYFNDSGQQVRGGIFNLGENYYVSNKDTGVILRNAFYHDTSTGPYGNFSENIYYAGNDGAFKTGWLEVNGNRYYASGYSDDDIPKGNLYTGVISSQLFSPDGKLLTNGL